LKATELIIYMIFQERREREQQELESAKEIADEDFDGFPWLRNLLVVTHYYPVLKNLQTSYIDVFVSC
jgi:hypothetical protein